MEWSLQVHFSIPTPKKALRETVPAWRRLKTNKPQVCLLQHVKKQPCPGRHRQSSSSPAPPGQGEITHKNRLTLFQVNSSSKIGYKSAKLGKQKSRLCTYGSAYEQENRSIVYNFLIHSTSFHCQFTETLKPVPFTGTKTTGTSQVA